MTQTSQKTSGKARTATPLGEKAARGFALFFGLSIGTKFITIVGQVVLSWILNPQAYGLVGLAYTISTFAVLIQQAGVREIVIQRGRRFGRWANPAFWFSLILGLLCAAVMIGAAPLAARFYKGSGLTGLIITLAVGNLLNSLTVVPEAKLQIDLRFKLVALLGIISTVGSMLLSIILAAMGMGAYSFILPVPLMAALRLALIWPLVRPPVKLNLQMRRWRYMITDSGVLLAASFFITVTWQGDYVILGRMYGDDVVGIYYWAFTLSCQTLQILAVNMAAVLLPSLSHLQREPARLLSAFMRAARMLTLLAVPACLLQAALARPGIHLFFAERYHHGIKVVQILSIGWALMTTTHVAISMLKAQGQFRTLLKFTSLSAAVFMACVYVGANYGMAVGTAWGVAVYAWCTGPLSIYLAIKPLGGTARDVWNVFAAPVLMSVTAIGPAMLAAMPIPATPGPIGELAQIGTILLISGAIYLAMMPRFSPEETRELAGKLKPLWNRLPFRSIPTAPQPRSDQSI